MTRTRMSGTDTIQLGGRLLVAVCLSAMVTLTAPGETVAQEQPLSVETKRLAREAAVGSDTYFGTVRASDLTALSYGARGCIIEVSDAAKRTRMVAAGEVLVRLDDKRSRLDVRTAEARTSELAAAIDERQLAIAAARADDRRAQEELDFVAKEFERNSVMLGRGLINESAMETIERRFMDANFAAERSKEAIANAEAALRRAEIALEIGVLDLELSKITLTDFELIAPFDGVLVGFDAKIGSCVQEGELAGQIYVPDQKSVDVFFQISRLTDPKASGVSVGATVNITRVNGEACEGTITRLDTEADPETQFVEATVDVSPSCAPALFLNESVEIEASQGADEQVFWVPNGAVSGENTVFLVDEDSATLVRVDVGIVQAGPSESLVRIPGAEGRLLVVDGRIAEADGRLVAVKEPG